jgi:hypothetical protein
MFGLGSFNVPGQVSLPCCGANTWVSYRAIGTQQDGEECGNWSFNVTFQENDPNNCISNIQDVRWFNPVTHHEVAGYNIHYFITGGSATIELKFLVIGTCGSQEFTVNINVDNIPDCPSNLCHSKIDYCKTLNGCWNVYGNQYEHDLIWIKMVDSNGNCFYLNAQNNPYGIFHFPYNLHHEEYCENHMPNMYDLINDLNRYLSPEYGHTGHAFICTYEGPPAPDCKIMFEIVGSDLSFQKWITYHWRIADCVRSLCNPAWWTMAEGNNCFSPYYCENQLPLVNSFGDFESDNIHFPEDQSTELDFVVEPNLSDDLISIRILSSTEIDNEIQIFNVTGEVVQYLSFEKNDLEFNISTLKSGMYFVRVSDKSTGISCIKKFIKI